MAQCSESMNRRVVLTAASVAAIATACLIISTTNSSFQSPPTFSYISYTNSGAQIEALFRLNHPPPGPALADGLYELRYQTPTGWARPSAPTVSWRFFG